jgi:hypothetical protein
MKRVPSEVRGLADLTGEGADLVHAAFGMRDGPPSLAIHRLDTPGLGGS